MLEQATQPDQTGWQKYLYPFDQVVSYLPKVVLDEAATSHLRYGRQIKIAPATIEPTAGGTDFLRAYTPTGEFLAILALADPTENMWRPKKVFQTYMVE
jgi:hypothetical protein